MSDNLSREDLEAIFNWNAEFTTAFKDIRADDMSKSPLNSILDKVTDIPAKVLDALKSTKA
jgi:hypothetical protein